MARLATIWSSAVGNRGAEGRQLCSLKSAPPMAITMTAYQPGSEKFLVLQQDLKVLLKKKTSSCKSQQELCWLLQSFVRGWHPVLEVSNLNKYVDQTLQHGVTLHSDGAVSYLD